MPKRNLEQPASGKNHPICTNGGTGLGRVRNEGEPSYSTIHRPAWGKPALVEIKLLRNESAELQRLSFSEYFLETRDAARDFEPSQRQMGGEGPVPFRDSERQKGFFHEGRERWQIGPAVQSQPDHARSACVGKVAHPTDLQCQRPGNSNRAQTGRGFWKLLLRQLSDEFQGDVQPLRARPADLACGGFSRSTSRAMLRWISAGRSMATKIRMDMNHAAESTLSDAKPS